MANVWKAMQKHQAEQAEASEAVDERLPHGHNADVQPAGRVSQPPAPAAAQTNASICYADVLVAYHDRGGHLAEEYRSLRTSLCAQNPGGQFAYVITSALAGEGKTVTCLNLALVMAERADRSTVVIDCDLRRSQVHALLDLPRSPGLVDVLRGEIELADAIRPTSFGNLFVITSGCVSHEDASELLARPVLEKVLGDIRRMYDHVLVDTPPINLVSDAAVVGGLVGEALLVIRMNKTRRESVERAVNLLHAANIKSAGAILTHRKYYIPKYIYRYS